MTKCPDVHAYLDCRILFAFHKQRFACFSYHYFSKKAGFASPNFLKLVMDGQRNLTSRSIAKVAEGFGLRKKEHDYFGKLGLIKKHDRGAWQLEHGDITTGSKIGSLMIANYHREMLSLANDSLERFPAGERDISSLSLGISRDRMDEFKQRLRDFRKEMLQLAATDEQPDRVIQFNFQLFPLTR